MEPTRVRVDRLIPGDWIIIDRPCLVRVSRTAINDQGGTFRGNTDVYYTDASPLDADGVIYLGGLVSVDKVK
jgi:hypothetical protein